MIHLSWDQTKNRKNRQKHGISFETAQKIFGDPYAAMEENQLVEGEQRYSTTGLLGTKFLTVIHTYVEEDDRERIHIVSARKATP